MFGADKHTEAIRDYPVLPRLAQVGTQKIIEEKACYSNNNDAQIVVSQYVRQNKYKMHANSRVSVNKSRLKGVKGE